MILSNIVDTLDLEKDESILFMSKSNTANATDDTTVKSEFIKLASREIVTFMLTKDNRLQANVKRSSRY